MNPTTPHPAARTRAPTTVPEQARFDPFALPYPALEARVQALGGRPTHALRWFRCLHRHGEADPGAVEGLGRALAARLREAARPAPVRLEAREDDPDGTVKLRLGLGDGRAVESVLIPDGERLTLCLSSQVGCAVGCAFCATGTMGLLRNLSPGEIVGQLQRAREVAARPVTNLVFMGMGEPLHNWPAVRTALALLRDPNAYAVARSKITVSTSGVLPRMADVVTRSRVALALSLHETRDERRAALIPLAARYPLAALVAELRRLARVHKAPVMVQYLLLAGVNDTPAHAAELWDWVRDFPCHINVLAYNPVPGLPFGRPSPEAVAAFRAELAARGARVAHRESRGGDVGGACGQLVTA